MMRGFWILDLGFWIGGSESAAPSIQYLLSIQNPKSKIQNDLEGRFWN
jgi:hypothetical protein